MSIALPVIDISNPHDATVGKAMLDAAAQHGFLYVSSQSTDFSAEDVQRAFATSKEFFASPAEEKNTCPITSNNRGWSGMHVETLDPKNQRTGDFKEGMNFGEFQNGKAQQPLPPSLESHEHDINHFFTLCRKTCDRILTLLALGLKIQPDFFTTRHNPDNGPSGSTLRYLYYPSIHSPATATYRPDEDVRAGAHSDYGSITLLFQQPGQPGLEILMPDGLSWGSVPVEPRPQAGLSSTEDEGQGVGFPPILVNIGDLLSYWTDGLLKSTVHRVVFPVSKQQSGGDNAQDRYSMVFFCHPVNSTELVPVPSEVVAEYRRNQGEEAGAGDFVPGKKALTAYEHLISRLDATYGFKNK